jgi:hypothetical protein
VALSAAMTSIAGGPLRHNRSVPDMPQNRRPAGAADGVSYLMRILILMIKMPQWFAACHASAWIDPEEAADSPQPHGKRDAHPGAAIVLRPWETRIR